MCTFSFGGLYYFNISHRNLTPKYFSMHLLGQRHSSINYNTTVM